MARTKIDFSGHKLEVIQSEGVLIHKFKRPNTSACMLVFINTCGVMTVTGDFGNWVFSREFHPSAGQTKVNDIYYDEKLQLNSVQTSKEFDSDEVMKGIAEFKEEYKELFHEEDYEAIEDWIEHLEESLEDEITYSFAAYREKPSCIDYESVPFFKKRRFALDAIYDGFEAICKVLREYVK